MSDPAAPRLLPLARPILAVTAVAGTLLCAVAFGRPIALLFAAGAVLVWVISLFWTSVQSLSGETPLTLDEALGLGAPSAEEERKRAVLRALKDLEFERGVGKISEEDYAELSQRYREEAKALLRSLDRDLSPVREKAEKRLAKRLQKEGLTGSASAGLSPEAEVEAKAPDDGTHERENEAPEESGGDKQLLECSECKVQNDPDARFCKGCGSRFGLEAKEPAQ